MTLLAVVCVLGNKCDLRDQRCVPLEPAQEYATSVGARHFETSALSEEGTPYPAITNVFMYEVILLFFCNFLPFGPKIQ